MHQYDPSINPPIPKANAKIQALDTDDKITSVQTTFYLDTGADLTVIPRQALDELFRERNVSYEFVPIMSYDGADVTYKMAYYVTVVIEDKYSVFTKVIATSDDVGLLGRDVLNKLMLEFRGPDLKWLVNHQNEKS